MDSCEGYPCEPRTRVAFHAIAVLGLPISGTEGVGFPTALLVELSDARILTGQDTEVLKPGSWMG